MMRRNQTRLGNVVDTLDAEHVACGNGMNHGEVLRTCFSIKAFAQSRQNGVGAIQARRRIDSHNCAIWNMAHGFSCAETILGMVHLLPRIMSAAFSAMAMVGALVLDETTCGMMELSHTRKAFKSMHAACKINNRHVITPSLQVPTG